MFNFDNSLMLAFSQFEKKNKKRFRIWHYIEENQKNFKFLKKKVVCRILDLGKSKHPEFNGPPFQRHIF